MARSKPADKPVLVKAKPKACELSESSELTVSPQTFTKLSALTPDSRNANKGTERGGQMLENSVRHNGMGRSILVDKNGRIIAGNKTFDAAGIAGIENVIIVKTDGQQVVAVQRMDLDLETDVIAKELAIADNRTGQVSLEWDQSVLADLNKEIDLGHFWTEAELAILLSDVNHQHSVGTLEQEKAFTYRVIVECTGEQHQAQLIESFESQGLKCQPLIS